MPIASDRIALQLRISKALHAKLKVVADKETRPINSQIEYYIKLGIERYERENGPIESPCEEEE